MATFKRKLKESKKSEVEINENANEKIKKILNLFIGAKKSVRNDFRITESARTNDIDDKLKLKDCDIEISNITVMKKTNKAAGLRFNLSRTKKRAE
ncbi:MAG: hypothetical protein KKD38_08390 [Candidatus Delongbacteria bacterium]|nr:hypothetical protein [Candidatus Delongbacteria bacterium]